MELSRSWPWKAMLYSSCLPAFCRKNIKDQDHSMKIDRLFTKEGQDPYQTLDFETRSSVIRNPDGSIVSEWKEVVVPSQWSQVATDIMAQKYFRKAGVPKHYAMPVKKTFPNGYSLLLRTKASFRKSKPPHGMVLKRIHERFSID